MSDAESKTWWLVYLYDYDDNGDFMWTTVGLVEDRDEWREWWLKVQEGEYELPLHYEDWWCSDRPVSVGLPDLEAGHA